MSDATATAQGGALVRRASIEELCGHRDRALELYRRAADTLVEAEKAHRRALVGASSTSGFPHDRLRYMDVNGGPSRFADECRTIVDRDMWRSFIVGTPIGGLMDAEERKRFEDSLTGHNAVVPEVTPESVEATMLRLHDDGPMLFRRGLVNAFRTLASEYRSHDGFKVGPKVILSYGFQVYRDGGLGSFQVDAKLRDVDRVFHVLDGKPAPEDHGAGACGAVRLAHGQRLTQAETDYFHLRWFGNGNLHIRFKRLDLLLKVNRIIAEHYGAAVGTSDGRARR